MEVDAALFSHALEANDPQVGRKVFVDMGVLPGRMSTPRYDAIFLSPLLCLYRVYFAWVFHAVRRKSPT